MRNVLYIFLRDLKRLAKAPAAWMVALFLIVLPSLYAWLNIAAFWDPYENTNHLKICVVNEDEGTENEMLGHLNVGENVISELKNNHELGWTFVDYDEAMNEIDAGHAYAAFVIPKDFSADIATIATENFVTPEIQYYVNEKKSPISPKITDVGATTLDSTINDAFFSTVSSKIAEIINDKLDEAHEKVSTSKSSAAKEVNQALEGINETRSTVNSLNETLSDALSKTASAKTKIESSKTKLDTLSTELKDASTLLGQTNTSLVKVTGEAHGVADKFSLELSQIAADMNTSIGQTSAAIERALAAVKALGGNSENADWNELLDALSDAAESSANASEAANMLVEDTLKRTDEYRDTLNNQTIPALSQSLSQISSTAIQLSTTVSNQKLLVDQTASLLDSLTNTLSTTSNAFGQTDKVLESLEVELTTVRTDIEALHSSNTLAELFGGKIDPASIASFMQSPTHIETENLYPLNSFGSAMAPLFINLTLWIGIFMLMVIFRLEVDEEEGRKLTITQRYFGRFLTLSCMGILQAVVCCAGCIVLGVQIENIFLFYLTAVIAALAYLAIQYTLSVTLQHVGKAICVILVFVQIPGATGLYPIEMTPDFFHIIYPLFPFTYGINGLRETICGFYDGFWGQCIGMLLLFMVIFILIGVVLRPYIINLNRMFAREINEGGLINGEAVQLPARRYRLSQVVKLVANRTEYRKQITQRIGRFIKLYPQLKRGALTVGLIILIALTVILAFCKVEKVIILTTWLLWFILMVLFFIVVEYLRDYLSHLASLNDMSEDEMRALVNERESFTDVQPLKEDKR